MRHAIQLKAACFCIAMFGACPVITQAQTSHPHPATYSRWRAEPEELTRLATAPVEELIAVLSRPDVWVRVPDDTVLGRTMVSMWLRSKYELYKRERRGAARSHLADMLESACANTRANALDVLLRDESEHLEPLKQRLIALTEDADRRVRIACFRVLAKVPGSDVEDALLTALLLVETVKREHGTDDKETRAIVVALCSHPVDFGEVVSTVAPLINESRSSTSLVWTAMRASAPLSRSKKFGGSLIARYWSILSTTTDGSLPYVATGAMDDDDPRTLACLRKAGEIVNPESRGYAAAELVSHSRFIPQRENELMAQLLGDQSGWVRRLTSARRGGRRAGRNDPPSR